MITAIVIVLAAIAIYFAIGLISAGYCGTVMPDQEWEAIVFIVWPAFWVLYMSYPAIKVVFQTLWRIGVLAGDRANGRELKAQTERVEAALNRAGKAGYRS